VGEESQSYEITKQDNFYYLFTLQSSDQNPITVQVELNKVPTEMELDTGASLSLINKRVPMQIKARSSPCRSQM